ncbi:hypothetical protein GON26_13650 [Flavobacterium sp. GA093]|uniref:Lipoprotein n=1 Tax=Flavobacterium hydrocarbonoxydans TaxID=2683249 RepID=A0A6I4NUP3_9FLAO|nr:hypothetical protein [Flavobacterium hydrocarbonoxydans]MWB95409.1 hypothetical protein [Flavobacterium hydrocarbonoxydans]
MKTKTIKLLSISLFILTSIFIVQSCAVPAMQSAQMTFKPKETKNGLIFGSITFPKQKAKFNGYFLRLICKSEDEKVSKKNSTEIQFSPEQIIKMKHKGQLDNGLTYLFAIERPEGDYEFSGIRLFTNSGIAILQRNDNLNDFSIPFKVNKGEIIYVGNINFNEYGGKNEKLITYQNNYEKDLAGIKKAQPYVYWDAAKNDSITNISYVSKQ